LECLGCQPKVLTIYWTSRYIDDVDHALRNEAVLVQTCSAKSDLCHNKFTQLKPGDFGTVWDISIFNIDIEGKPVRVIWITWDSGSRFALIEGKDEFEIMETHKIKIEEMPNPTINGDNKVLQLK
jgi:hypothetical protein